MEGDRWRQVYYRHCIIHRISMCICTAMCYTNVYIQCNCNYHGNTKRCTIISCQRFSDSHSTWISLLENSTFVAAASIHRNYALCLMHLPSHLTSIRNTYQLITTQYDKVTFQQMVYILFPPKPLHTSRCTPLTLASYFWRLPISSDPTV